MRVSKLRRVEMGYFNAFLSGANLMGFFLNMISGRVGLAIFNIIVSILCGVASIIDFRRA